MLSVRPSPRMGSSQAPFDPFLPFGYNVDANGEPILDAPEPPPGAPLLTDTDSKFLSSFFSDISANQYNMPSFGEGLNFSDAWLEMPPTLMGTATSYGQQQQGAAPMPSPGSQGLSQDQLEMSRTVQASHMMPPPPPPPSQQHQAHQQRTQRQSPNHMQHPSPHSQHSDEVLNAAATLLQNGNGPRRLSTSSDGSQQRRPLGPPVGHLRHQPLEDFKEEGRRGMPNGDIDNTFADWMFPPPERRQSRTSNMQDLQWGSDANFNLAQAYRAEAGGETVEAHRAEQMRFLDGLDVNPSAATTRQNSPSAANHIRPTTAVSNPEVGPSIKEADEDDSPPRKRRKSKVARSQADDDETAEATPQKPAARKKKAPKSDRQASSPADEVTTNGKRRKSTAAGAKAPRENLTEEQKRENHIRSEQKRRTLIKEGFDDLCILVPGLRGGGLSKSTMLSMAADWLEELVRGNEELKAKLGDS